jgi:hypothetical protein
MRSSDPFWEKAREKGLLRTFLYAAIGSVLMAQDFLRSTFNRLIEKGETSDDPCARTVRDWLDRRERKKGGSS